MYSIFTLSKYITHSVCAYCIFSVSFQFGYDKEWNMSDHFPTEKNTIGLSLQYRWVAVMSASREENGKHSEEEMKQNTEDITQNIWNSRQKSRKLEG